MRHATRIVVWLALWVFSGCSFHILDKPEQQTTLVAPNSPAAGYRWVPGRWTWKKKDGTYAWREGRWTTGRRHTKWVEGYWIHTGKGYRYVAGHWR